MSRILNVCWTNFLRKFLERRPWVGKLVARLRIVLGIRRAGAYMALGHIHSQLQQHAAALRCYHRACTLKPRDCAAFLAAGESQCHLEKYDAAIALYRNAIGLAPHQVTAYLALGNILTRERRYVAAAECYRQGIRCNPENSKEMHFALVRLLTEYPELVGAEQPLLPHLKADTSREAQADWQELSFGFISNVSELCSDFDSAIASDPYNMHFHRASIYHFFANAEYKLAMTYIRRCEDAKQSLCQLRQVNNDQTRYLRETWTARIGHIQLIDCYIKAGLLGWRPPRRTIVLAYPQAVANKAYLDYFRPYLADIVTDPVRVEELLPEAECLEEQMLLFNRDNHPLFAPQAQCLVEEEWEAAKRPPLLTLRDEDATRGRARLRQLGVPADAWFVGLHVREPGFHVEGHDNHFFRNSNIANYQLAIRSVTARGGWVIRMGSPTSPKLEPMAQVIDYAHSNLRSDWMDVFLCASMRFMIGTNSGLSHVPLTFGVPAVQVNWSFYGQFPWFRDDLFICKLMWSEAEKRYLSLQEIYDTGLAFALSTHVYDKYGIRLLDNTAEDIDAVVVEMLDRIDGRSDKQRSCDFNKQLKTIVEPHGVSLLNQMGTGFLQKYGFLLSRSSHTNTAGLSRPPTGAVRPSAWTSRAS
jgi:putative glycosyltransferase (TIGR04372 family)